MISLAVKQLYFSKTGQYNKVLTFLRIHLDNPCRCLSSVRNLLSIIMRAPQSFLWRIHRPNAWFRALQMENSTNYYKIQGFSSSNVTVSITVLHLQCIHCPLYYPFPSRTSILIPLVVWGQRMDFKCGVVDTNMKMETACCSKTNCIYLSNQTISHSGRQQISFVFQFPDNLLSVDELLKICCEM